MARDDFLSLPEHLPVPTDDGAADHLPRALLPAVGLRSTQGSMVRLSELSGPTVLFFYPRTGRPDETAPENWDQIPGARGCTPQNCSFRDTFSRFQAHGVTVYGVSTQTTDYHHELRERLHLPYHVLSDAELALTRAMKLPTFEYPVKAGGPSTLIKRMAWYCDGARVRRVWYPVFPSNTSAQVVLAWLDAQARVRVRASTPADAAFVREELHTHWHDTQIWSIGRQFDADQLPAFIAELDGLPAGLVTYAVQDGGYQCEVVTLSSRAENAGVATRLLEAAEDAARRAGCVRIYLTTTNDNLRALGFYQKRGWRLAALHKGNVDAARQRKPFIPVVGLNGIRVRDEIELELWLQ